MQTKQKPLVGVDYLECPFCRMRIFMSGYRASGTTTKKCMGVHLARQHHLQMERAIRKINKKRDKDRAKGFKKGL